MSTTSVVRVFISYAWEDASYRQWVERLAVTLCKMGVNARLDTWHLDTGLTIAEFMNREIRAADKVLVLCSPEYRTKVHAMEDGEKLSGAGWESMLIGSGIFGGSLPRERVVVALSRGKWSEAAPTFLEGQVYVDLTDEARLRERLGDLLRRLVGARAPVPPLGPLPANLERSPAESLIATAVAKAGAPPNRTIHFVLMMLAVALGTVAWARRGPAREEPASPSLAKEFFPTILEVYRTADDLETGSSLYSSWPPSSDEVFGKQIIDLEKVLGSYNAARFELSRNHDRFEAVIRQAAKRNETLREDAQSLMDNDCAELRTFDPPHFDSQPPSKKHHPALLAEWNANRTLLKGQLSRLQRGIQRFQKVLFENTGASFPQCP